MEKSEWDKLSIPFPPFETISENIDEFFQAISQSTLLERPQVYQALEIIHKHQPQFSQSLISFYIESDLPFQKRYLVLQLLGELKQPETLDFFTRQVWLSLPPEPDREVSCTELTERSREEILRCKMVNGIGFLRTDLTFSELERLMKDHESYSVRTEAINTYMWNSGDTKEAASHLYQLLPPAYHPYVERPRFHRGMNPRHFIFKTVLWKKRWFKNGQGPINPRVLASSQEKKARHGYGL